jgi:CBS domain-containing protein
MIQAPFYLTPDHSAFDAAIAMTERHIAHVCLVKDRACAAWCPNAICFSLQRVDLVHLARTIRNAQRVDSLSNPWRHRANW